MYKSGRLSKTNLSNIAQQYKLMTLKQYLSLYLSIAFAMLFGLALLFIYYSFSNFRSQEFADRLKEEALSDIKLFVKIQNIDKELLRTIDNNEVHKLYNEKTLIFDTHQKLVYSSVPDALIKYYPSDLAILKTKSFFFRKQNGQELFGLVYKTKGNDYYVIIAAEDIYGLSKLRYLAYTLLLVFVVGCLLVGGMAYLIVMRSLKPLDILRQTISEITVQELKTQLPENRKYDEINSLSKSFNQMLQRIEAAYQVQRSFTAQASHELRTPVSRLSLQLDNLLQEQHPKNTQNYLTNMHNDVQQLGGLVESLTILTHIYNKDYYGESRKVSIDEVIFNAYKVIKKQFADFEMELNIVENEDFVPNLEIPTQATLLEIVFINLLKNAYLYADNKQILIEIKQENKTAQLQVILTNTASKIIAEPQNATSLLTDAFRRGDDTQHIPGSGLGLPIALRILKFHKATISYTQLPPNLHQFVVVFEQN